MAKKKRKPDLTEAKEGFKIPKPMLKNMGLDQTTKKYGPASMSKVGPWPAKRHDPDRRMTGRPLQV